MSNQVTGLHRCAHFFGSLAQIMLSMGAVGQFLGFFGDHNIGLGFFEIFSHLVFDGLKLRGLRRHNLLYFENYISLGKMTRLRA